MQAKPTFYNSAHFQKFWNEGNGKELIDWAGTQPNIQNFEKYAHLYHEVDHLGDEAVKDTYLKLPYNEASAIVQNWTKNKILETDNAPESLKKMFLQMQHIPDWFDPELANTGARFCMRSGTNALIVLRDFTLMGGYDFAYLNKPLIFTGALKKGAVKRLKETLEFWVRVTRENGLTLHSDAYKLIVRTRLMHSYARLSIRKKVTDWNFEKWGEPINHWDMIATYTGFSLVTMQGLKKLGVKISEEEELGVYHLWKYIGYLLGIPEQFLPENSVDAVQQLFLWSSIQHEGDQDSALLAHALLEENLTNTIYKFKFQRNLLLKLHQSMNWFMLDKEVNERLQIPYTRFTQIFPQMVCAANGISQKMFNLNDPEKYSKLVDQGNKQQMKVLEDYIKNTPKDFHY